MQRDRSAEPRIDGHRRGFLRFKGPKTPAAPGKGQQTLPSTRVRQQRPFQIPLEEPRTTGPFGTGTSAVSWVILMGGMLLAIGGVVHASWPSPADQQEASTSISQGALNQQIVQLKAELDKERAEKTELIDAMASAKASELETPAKPVVQNVTQMVPQESNAAPVEAQVAELKVPGPATDEEDSSLPQPMAPSVELMLSDLPLTAVPVDSGSIASAPQGFGIHLASFADRNMAERGWELLQRNHSSALGQLRPRIDEAKDDKGNSIFLLIAGPFETEELASAHCRKINTQVVFCKPRPFSGSDIAAALQQ